MGWKAATGQILCFGPEPGRLSRVRLATGDRSPTAGPAEMQTASVVYLPGANAVLFGQPRGRAADGTAEDLVAYRLADGVACRLAERESLQQGFWMPGPGG